MQMFAFNSMSTGWQRFSASPNFSLALSKFSWNQSPHKFEKKPISFAQISLRLTKEKWQLPNKNRTRAHLSELHLLHIFSNALQMPKAMSGFWCSKAHCTVQIVISHKSFEVFSSASNLAAMTKAAKRVSWKYISSSSLDRKVMLTSFYKFTSSQIITLPFLVDSTNHLIDVQFIHDESRAFLWQRSSPLKNGFLEMAFGVHVNSKAVGHLCRKIAHPINLL